MRDQSAKPRKQAKLTVNTSRVPKTGEHIPLELQHTDFQDFGLEPMYAAPKAIDEQAKREASVKYTMPSYQSGLVEG